MITRIEAEFNYKPVSIELIRNVGDNSLAIKLFRDNSGIPDYLDISKDMARKLLGDLTTLLEIGLI